MTLPESITTIQITGDLVDALGRPAKGRIEFRNSMRIFYPEERVIIVPKPFMAYLNYGSIPNNFKIPANDDGSPELSTYEVIEYVIGLEPVIYNISVLTINGLVQDLTTLASAGTVSSTGEVYIIGPRGDIGPQGIQGPQGIAGEVADTGPQGIQGIQGIQGPIGPQGIQGILGPQGIQGPIGPQGIKGDTGNDSIVAGPQGIQGDIGNAGIQGIQGIQGNVGSQGIQGIQGPTGNDALQTRQTIVLNTANIGIDVLETGTINLSAGWRLYKIVTNIPARVRLYSSIAQRDADSSRPIGTDPINDHGLMCEYITTIGKLSAVLSPIVDGVVLEAASSALVPYNITNKSTGASIVSITLIYLRTE